MSDKLTYNDSGVDIHEGYKAVEMMKEHVKGTFNKNVLTGLGGFGGLFNLDLTGIKEPVLVSGTDGVGTKLKIAFLMDKHDTVGQDLVAMCVNDILCQGAKPLFFLDYIATGKLKAEKAANLVKGVADGCKLSGAALIGGETAEMPGFYGEGEYDMAGFTVGVVDKSKIITGENISEGDAIIGLSSSGIHSNGFSLVRKLFFDKLGMTVESKLEGMDITLGEALIEPTRIYVNSVLKTIEKHVVKGMSHITGGGFIENIPRVLPEGLDANINLGSWDVPEIFKFMQEKANLENSDIYNTFNMGIGFVMIVDKAIAEDVVATIKSEGDSAYVIGEIVKGNKEVNLCQL